MADLIISQPMTFTVDVKTGLVERPQRESLMRGDRYANRIIVELVDGSEPFDITGVTVKGEFCKPPNGDSINLSGEAKGNVAEVQLTDQCYTAGGHYEARVILVLGEVERTVLFISGDVLKSGSGNAAGEEPIPGGGGGTGGGLPAGGTAGQVLVKVSSAQGDAIWKTLTASDVGARPNTWTPTAEDVGARPDNWTPTAADVGALPSGGTAVDSEKLDGKNANEYLLHADALTLEEIQASTDLTGKIPDAESAKLVDITDRITISDITYGTYYSHRAYRCGRVIFLELQIAPQDGVRPGSGDVGVMLKVSNFRPLGVVTTIMGYGTRLYYVRFLNDGYFIIEPKIEAAVGTDVLTIGFTYLTGES